MILRKLLFVPNTTDFLNTTELNLKSVPNIDFHSREEWKRVEGVKGTGIVYRLPDHCSVFREEIAAIKESFFYSGKECADDKEYVYIQIHIA